MIWLSKKMLFFLFHFSVLSLLLIVLSSLVGIHCLSDIFIKLPGFHQEAYHQKYYKYLGQ